ncbi:MAG: carboxypeptidase-like regulatory domain-containing protein [Thermoplasmata archaeon]
MTFPISVFQMISYPEKYSRGCFSDTGEEENPLSCPSSLSLCSRQSSSDTGFLYIDGDDIRNMNESTAAARLNHAVNFTRPEAVIFGITDMLGYYYYSWNSVDLLSLGYYGTRAAATNSSIVSLIRKADEQNLKVGVDMRLFTSVSNESIPQGFTPLSSGAELVQLISELIGNTTNTTTSQKTIDFIVLSPMNDSWYQTVMDALNASEIELYTYLNVNHIRNIDQTLLERQLKTSSCIILDEHTSDYANLSVAYAYLYYLREAGYQFEIISGTFTPVSNITTGRPLTNRILMRCSSLGCNFMLSVKLSNVLDKELYHFYIARTLRMSYEQTTRTGSTLIILDITSPADTGNFIEQAMGGENTLGILINSLWLAGYNVMLSFGIPPHISNMNPDLLVIYTYGNTTAGVQTLSPEILNLTENYTTPVILMCLGTIPPAGDGGAGWDTVRTIFGLSSVGNETISGPLSAQLDQFNYSFSTSNSTSLDIPSSYSYSSPDAHSAVNSTTNKALIISSLFTGKRRLFINTDKLSANASQVLGFYLSERIICAEQPVWIHTSSSSAAVLAYGTLTGQAFNFSFALGHEYWRITMLGIVEEHGRWNATPVSLNSEDILLISPLNATIVGKVHDDYNISIADAVVVFNNSASKFIAISAAGISAAGQYAISIPLPLPVTLTVTATKPSGYQNYTGSITIPSGPLPLTLDITMERFIIRKNVNGTVLNNSNEPIEGVEVYYIYRNQKYNTTTDANGYFLLSNVPTGMSHTIFFYHPSYYNKSENITVQSSSDYNMPNIILEFIPLPLATYRGYIRLNETPSYGLSGAEVIIGGKNSLTNATGFFEIINVSTLLTDLNITIRLTNHDELFMALERPINGSVNWINLTINATKGVIKGGVRDYKTQNPIANAQLVFSYGGFNYSTKSNETGEYEILLNTSAPFNLTVTATDYDKAIYSEIQLNSTDPLLFYIYLNLTNRPPQISSLKYDVSYGKVEIYLNYSDRDNDSGAVSVVINNISYPMAVQNPSDVNYTVGVRYFVSVAITGECRLYINATDSRGLKATSSPDIPTSWDDPYLLTFTVPEGKEDPLYLILIGLAIGIVIAACIVVFAFTRKAL